MNQLASGLDTLTTAMGAILTVASYFYPIARVAALVVGGLTALSKGIKLAGEQSEALFKTFQDLSKTGQSTAGGMTEVFNNMQKFGYGIKELPHERLLHLLRVHIR
jgi:predicted phage tail protein